MKVKMQLLSDVIFGNGMSVPGGEDRSVLLDKYGFPYYKGGTMKGIFREEMARYLKWTMGEEQLIQDKLAELLGETGDSDVLNDKKIIFSDFTLSKTVRDKMLEEIGENREEIRDSLTHLRTFTRIDENGIVAEGSLRSYRCVNKGLYFYSEVTCIKEDKELVKRIFSMIKWIGTMRSRGFGKVRITVEEQGD